MEVGYATHPVEPPKGSHRQPRAAYNFWARLRRVPLRPPVVDVPVIFSDCSRVPQISSSTRCWISEEGIFADRILRGLGTFYAIVRRSLWGALDGHQLIGCRGLGGDGGRRTVECRVRNNNNNTIWGGSVLTGKEPPPHSGELNHALSQAGGPTQSQLSARCRQDTTSPWSTDCGGNIFC